MITLYFYHIKTMKNVEYNPTVGGTPATKEKIKHSGIYINDIVKPEIISALNYVKLFL
jgi:hypothetical protein